MQNHETAHWKTIRRAGSFRRHLSGRRRPRVHDHACGHQQHVRGSVTLQISGLTAGDTVVVQKFLDLNTNGVIDASDYLVQQFNLTDGQAGHGH